MQSGQLKIGDFGTCLSYERDLDLIRQSAGSPAFVPPELCSVEEFAFPPNGVDIWAAGITLWVFLFGKCPFLGEDIPSTYEAILHQPLEFPSETPLELQDLLQRILEKDPHKRITIPEILQHPWISSE